MVDFRKAAARNGPAERPGRARPLSQFESLGGTLVIICAPNVLTPEELGVIRSELQDAAFVDGASTAGWSAREVKKNLQVDINTESQARLRDIVRNAFLRNAMLQASILPSAMTQVMFNRYDVGMQYGRHVDAPVMGGLGSAVRTDVAITIFLSDAKSYVGGDLMVESNGVEYGFKLAAGSAIAYPANSLHHVTPVTQGARHAAIIWVQSQVRDSAKRELLWDLDNAKRQIFGREGKSPTFDAVSKSHANLLRMWADV
ncbi:Fe2+-dependent dioxygenase [Rhodanobacter soli]|uniref:Fe2+-dependent dioxygenase n=1 Tax=Rhodanobacter soli TaxID=590609 RepID=UPI0031D8506A